MHKHIRLLLCNSQESYRRTAGLTPTLFPILNSAQTHAHETRERRLRQFQSLSNYFGRRRRFQGADTQYLLTRLVFFDFPNTIENFLTNITLSHFQFPLRSDAEHEREYSLPHSYCKWSIARFHRLVS